MSTKKKTLPVNPRPETPGDLRMETVYVTADGRRCVPVFTGLPWQPVTYGHDCVRVAFLRPDDVVPDFNDAEYTWYPVTLLTVVGSLP